MFAKTRFEGEDVVDEPLSGVVFEGGDGLPYIVQGENLARSREVSHPTLALETSFDVFLYFCQLLINIFSVLFVCT